jgi:hypothetical protein
MSSIKAENPYRFMNRLAGLAFYLKEDNKSVVGHYVDDVNREKVRIACHFNISC